MIWSLGAAAQRAAATVGVEDRVFGKQGFDSEISALVSFRVGHLGPPSALHPYSFIYSYLESIRRLFAGTRVQLGI